MVQPQHFAGSRRGAALAAVETAQSAALPALGGGLGVVKGGVHQVMVPEQLLERVERRGWVKIEEGLGGMMAEMG